ncbi:LamG-like jellyroll fold domain-containing protein [Rufibacter ruber]|uniref:LamG-like jellyroll fold domain-containing protein n=1 Tax=Rufibacter ruber TaxID=1783499 RepID=UPI000834BF9E|nr:LamG-like jellyroll fold domain-containing protein [Rufibacter ruber]
MQKSILTFLLCCVSLIGSAQITAPGQSNILKFNNSGVFAPVDDRLKLGGEFTFSAWVNPTARTPHSLIVGKPATDRDTDPWMTYVLGWNNTGNRVEFVQTTGAAGTYRSIASPNDIPLNTWTHMAATLSGGTMQLYINGQLAGSIQSPGLPQSNNVPFGIGGGINKGNYCCGSNAYIKQVGVWSRALSAAEVQAVAQAVPAANANGLVAFWMLDEGSGQMAQDRSGNNLHATLGMTATADPQDPIWHSTFYTEKEPFFASRATTISPALPHGLEDIYPMDINQDGRLEFLGVSIAWPPTPFPGTFRPIQVLATHQNLTVTNQTATFIPAGLEMVHPRHIAVADFNKDGFKDLVMIGHGTDTHPFPGEQSQLLFGQADGTLRNVTSTHFPQSIDFTHHVSAADIDGDNDVDLYMANIGGGTNGPLIYLNNGSGVFSVGTNNLPVAVAASTWGRLPPALSQILTATVTKTYSWAATKTLLVTWCC